MRSRTWWFGVRATLAGCAPEPAAGQTAKDQRIGTLARAPSLLVRAEQRLDGADAVIRRETIVQGEFDNGFDGIVSAIFHVVDAFELATTGLRRDPREADQATRITAVITMLRQHGVGDVPAAARLIGLNTRRNTSVHGEFLDVLDREELAAAIRAGRMLLAAVRADLDRNLPGPRSDA